MARTLSVCPEEVKMSTHTLIRWTYSTNQYSPSVSSERTSTVCDILVKCETIALLRETVGLTTCVGQPLHISSIISSFRSIPNLRKYRKILSMKFKYNNNECNHGRDAINTSLCFIRIVLRPVTLPCTKIHPSIKTIAGCTKIISRTRNNPKELS